MNSRMKWKNSDLFKGAAKKWLKNLALIAAEHDARLNEEIKAVK